MKEQYTIVIVTHNMQQAARVAEFTGFFLLGSLIEFDKTEKIFTNPSRQTDGRLHYRQVWIMRTRFQQGLDELKEKLLRMGGLAEQAVDRARRGLSRTRDLSTSARWCSESESRSTLPSAKSTSWLSILLAMQQPMAVDLRFILAV